MDLLDFKSHADLGSFVGEGSSSWGWVSADGREFAAIGQADGTAFAEITPKGKLVYLGRLPQQSVFSIWREIRVFHDYMIIGSEAVGHGIQIFDMKKLLDISPSNPKNFSTKTDLTGLFTQLPVGRTHNVVTNEERNYIVSVGAAPRNSTCRAGLIFIDMTDPTKPTTPGCAGQDGYVHDAQCVVYRGPDTRYYDRDICYGYNEDTLTIYDVTSKIGINASRIISKTSYAGASYSHQGSALDHSLILATFIVLLDRQRTIMREERLRDPEGVAKTERIARLHHTGQLTYWQAADFGVTAQTGSSNEGAKKSSRITNKDVNSALKLAKAGLGLANTIMTANNAAAGGGGGAGF